MECSHHPRGRVAALVEEGSEAGEESPDVGGGFVFVTHRVHCFKACVIVDDDESVATATVDGWKEGPGYGDVDESSGVSETAYTNR
eukprot:6212023-Pleurochrysis_carterae.AAC.4